MPPFTKNPNLDEACSLLSGRYMALSVMVDALFEAAGESKELKRALTEHFREASATLQGMEAISGPDPHFRAGFEEAMILRKAMLESS